MSAKRFTAKNVDIRPYEYRKIDDSTAVIPVKSGDQWLDAMVDLSIAEELAGYNWHKSSEGYARSAISKKPLYMHRMVLGSAFGERIDVDHVNGDRLDNRSSNLRVVPHHVNMRNVKKLRPNNTSGYVGVSWHNIGKKWAARYRYKLKRYHIGLFSTAEEAAMAYDNAIRALNLPKPYFLNFPAEGDQ
jgi:hypothetical protein